MILKKTAFGLTAIMLATLSCGQGTTPSQPAQPPVNTMTAGTFQALTANAPATESSPDESSAPTSASPEAPTQEAGQLTPHGTPFNSAEVSFFIPNGVANDATSAMNTNVEYPYINPGGGDMPQHLTATLNLYTLTGKINEPQIMVFRAAEYAQYSELTAKIVESLKGLQYVDGQPLNEYLDGPTFTAQIHGLNFQNGSGIRYLTQVSMDIMPADNQGMFYYFQGLTSDGIYLVQATLPINVPFLAADSNPNTPLPADGIPFNRDDPTEYFDALIQRLDSTDSFNFTPYMDALDEMIQSIQVTGF